MADDNNLRLYDSIRQGRLKKETHEKPAVICHMACTVNGKIISEHWGTWHAKFGDVYEQCSMPHRIHRLFLSCPVSRKKNPVGICV
jgi:hypothetical protein